MNQNTLTLLLGVALLGGLAFYFVGSGDEGKDSTSDAQILPEIAMIAERLESMDERMLKMEQRLDSSANRPVSQGVDRSLDAETINQMIADALDQRGSSILPESQAEDRSEELIAEANDKLLNDSIAKLLDPNFSGQNREELWDQLKEQGLLEEAISLLEQEVQNDPENLNLMNQLGDAYLQPIIRGGVAGMDAGKWSMKADGIYDQVLAADSENWEARFSKAISYSFWPPMFGKQPEAIRHFEILVGQQENQTSNPQFAQTHFLLGNLYEQQGNHDKAMEAWSVGYERFPEDAALRKQLGLE